MQETAGVVDRMNSAQAMSAMFVYVHVGPEITIWVSGWPGECDQVVRLLLYSGSSS